MRRNEVARLSIPSANFGKAVVFAVTQADFPHLSSHGQPGSWGRKADFPGLIAVIRHQITSVAEGQKQSSLAEKVGRQISKGVVDPKRA